MRHACQQVRELRSTRDHVQLALDRLTHYHRIMIERSNQLFCILYVSQHMYDQCMIGKFNTRTIHEFEFDRMQEY